ncbi:hypothetical protein QTI66_26675 [Variovorax sp. J22R133]|uniref:hypothetical protein n=1 Tax=Variovorax brevis TaxID=3053503 RepID=UPI002576F01E|nr:hypothetical protein [Variovorax sp. J22R133]MDM0115762.1 hypothetical protein [Variovorax sp. J22R133]
MNPSPLSRPPRQLDRRELCLAGALALLTLFAAFAPAIPGSVAGGTFFADVRPWAGLPHALNVLSNLPFLVIGVIGLRWLRALERLHDRVAAGAALHAADELPINALDCAWLFFAGLILIAAGSVFYHLQPDALRLAADRAGMAVAFAGIIGMAVCERVSPRAGWPAAWFALAAGLLAVAIYYETGNTTPWVVVEVGGMALVTGMALTRPVGHAGRALGLRLGWTIFFYAIAKLFELSDGLLFEATRNLISGHTLKHLAAALAALPVLQAVQGIGRSALLHNPRSAHVTV